METSVFGLMVDLLKRGYISHPLSPGACRPDDTSGPRRRITQSGRQ